MVIGLHERFTVRGRRVRSWIGRSYELPNWVKVRRFEVCGSFNGQAIRRVVVLRGGLLLLMSSSAAVVARLTVEDAGFSAYRPFSRVEFRGQLFTGPPSRDY